MTMDLAQTAIDALNASLDSLDSVDSLETLTPQNRQLLKHNLSLANKKVADILHMAQLSHQWSQRLVGIRSE